MKFRRVWAWVVLALASGPMLSTNTAAEDAARFIENYARLENAFDPAFADLIDDDAVIASKEEGRIQPSPVPTPTFKQIIKRSMQLARLQPYSAAYTVISAIPEGERIRVVAMRVTKPDNFRSREEFLIRPTSTGQWSIAEMTTERL